MPELCFSASLFSWESGRPDIPCTESSISSMAELEDVMAKLLDDPATEPIASEIGGASGLSLFSPMKNHLGKFYSPSTGTML